MLEHMSLNLEDIYRDLHQHPELSFQEHRTAKIIADALTELGITHQSGIGQTGVVAIIENGPGPVVWLRADMDGLPVKEETGLEYASTDTGIDDSGRVVPTMHACGHDMHMAALLGALEILNNDRDSFSGTIVGVFQPAEEFGAGARAMLDDGLFELAPKPDIVLGQHLTPLPIGTIGLRPATQMAACDGIRVTLHGRGGHGSRPHATIDPVVMAASTIMRLQTVVSREVDPREMAVVTVGAIHAGLKNNIISSEAVLDISMRYPNEQLREHVIERVERVINAEAAASGAETPPTIETLHTLPPTINDSVETARLSAAFDAALGAGTVIDPGMFTGSEDVSWFARDAEVPLVFWFWGGLDPVRYATAEAAGRIAEDIPTNHSPFFAPMLQPTLNNGVANLVIAAREYLD